MGIGTRPRIGVSDLVYAVLDETTDVIGGEPAYGAVKTLANAGKVTVNTGGSGAVLFADDGPRLIAETIGKIDLDFELADMTPSAYSELLGHTYALGTIVEKATDQSPYIAIGFKALRAGRDVANLVYDYFWVYKGKMFKPTDTYETKKDSINFQNVVLKGQFVALMADDSYRMRLRTDDAEADPTLIANFFAQVTREAADTSELEVAIAQGATVHVGDVKLTFTKVSTDAFNISAGSLTTTNIVVVNQTEDDEVIVTGVFSTPATGASVIVYFTPDEAFTNADDIFIYVSGGVVDNSGVHCTPTTLLKAWVIA